MNNLKKYTKAELISKLKRSETKSDIKLTLFNQINSYLHQIWDLIMIFKNILLKLTFISLIIQIFKKYRIFRTLWKIINTIVMSIFGISLLDNFGFEFIKNFLIELKVITGNITNYLTNTNFYLFLEKLFSQKEEVTNSRGSEKSSGMDWKNSTNKEETSESIERSKGNSRISDWLKPEEKPEPVIEDNKTNYIKYFIIGGTIIIVTSLGWVYWDEVKSTTQSILEWYFSSRSGGDNNPGNNTDGSSTPTRTNIPINSRPASPDIELSDKTRLTSPSLEDLNEKVKESWSEQSKSPGSPSSSTSSTETIKPSSSKVKLDDGILSKSSMDETLIETIKPSSSKDILSETRSIEQVIDNNWKNLINSKVKESIEYVESHFPKSDIEDSTYIKTLIHEVKKENVNYAQEIRSKIKNLSSNELRYANALAQKTDLWIEIMEEKLKNLE
nr:hypothetical protein [Russula sp.]